MTRPRSATRRAAVVLLVTAAALLLLAPVAGADVFTPESGSPNADRIDTLYKITFAIGVVVFLGVEGTLLYSLIRHRFRRGAPEPDQIRGNTRLEVGWTIGAALILVVITAVTFAMLPSIRNPEAGGPGGLARAEGTQYAATDQPAPPGGERLRIRVVGQQYLWRYDYPGGVFSYHTMIVPLNTTVTLEITASDVIHSFWVPQLFGKADATPGYTNRTWFKATEAGYYEGNCAELCGENHAQMRNAVRAVPVDEYERWLERQKADIRASQEALAEQRRAREAAAGAPQ